MGVNILVLDDDAVACEFLQETLHRVGYRVDTCTSGQEALARDLSRYDALLSDIRMPGMDGLEFLRNVQKRWPDLPVILMTAYGDLETTMEAIRTGAWDYISKPFSPEAIRAMVQRILEVRGLQRLRVEDRRAAPGPAQFTGSSPPMVEFYKQLARVADAEASVLIEGESGTGKELAARSLHQLSGRRERPFVPVHCGAIPDNLLESELFGYDRGAFTGADHSHEGLLASAQGGTIFLDEITEMSAALQGKLLRFMQNGEVRRLGSHEVRHVAVRVVAAANRNIDEEVRRGRFRADLLYRFVVRLRVPSLRDHMEDLPRLVESLLKKLGYPSVRISEEALQGLMAYDWPGNVRELENVLQQSLLLSPYGLIRPEDLPARIARPGQGREAGAAAMRGDGGGPPGAPAGRFLLEEAERKQILRILQTTGWNQSRAARLLGIDRNTLRNKIRRYGLRKEGSEGGSPSAEHPSIVQGK